MIDIQRIKIRSQNVRNLLSPVCNSLYLEKKKIQSVDHCGFCLFETKELP